MTAVLDSRCGRTLVLVGALSVLAVTVIALPAPAEVRGPIVLAFALLAPGAAVASLLGIRDPAGWLMITIMTSLAVLILASEFAAAIGGWNPHQQLLGLALLSSAAAFRAWQLDQPTPER